MVPTPQIGSNSSSASIHRAISNETVVSPSDRFDGQAAVSASSIGDPSGTVVSWLTAVRTASTWETALIVVLFVLVSGLVGIRVAETVSDHDGDLSSFPPGSTAAEADESESSPTEEHRSYEHYLSPDTPSELLSDEGEVVRLLVANRGRIRQHQIAEETGWSKSKVSRICSQMDADGTIEKTSVGRENVITLSDRQSDAESESHPDDVENPLP